MNSLLVNPYPRVGVGIIIMKGNKVLLGKRRGPRSSGTYGLPGGFLERNENFTQGAKREVKEETGVNCIALYPLFLIGGISDNIQFVDIVFYAKCENGKPSVQETERVEKWEWFNISNLPSPLYKPTELVLSKFVSKYYFYKINVLLQNWGNYKRVTIEYLDFEGKA